MLSFASFGVNCIFENGVVTASGDGTLNQTDVTNAVTSKGKSITDIKKVKIKDGITSINWYAFDGCSALSRITIPKSVKTIGIYAFNNCTSLETVIFAEDSILEGISTCVFQNCSKLKNITIPNNVKTIGDGAFYCCKALESITIPNNVTNIYYQAFAYCSSLTNVTIQGVVTSISKEAFMFCANLKTVTFQEGSTLKTIDEKAFYGCISLESIVIPGSVMSIGDNAFGLCTALNRGNVYYIGTEAKWDNITIYDKNDPLTSAKRHYSNILTVKKVWEDNNNSGLRSKPQLVLCVKKSGSGYDEINNGYEKKYIQYDFTYKNGAEKKEWQCKILICDFEEGSTYAVGEKRMKGYTSNAYVD